MLKTLKLPTAEEFEASLDEAQKWVTSVGYEESDVDDIIKSARKNKKYENIQIITAKEFCKKIFIRLIHRIFTEKVRTRESE